MAGLRALVLAGGRGTRFWPLSRRARPKQLLELIDGKSLLRHTLDRLAPLIEHDAVWICTTEDLVEPIRAQAPEIEPSRILAEPQGRNTAPAIAWSMTRMAAQHDGCVVVLPSDHWVADPVAFRRVLAIGRGAVEQEDSVVTLGVPPRWPETGFGYIELEHEYEDAVDDPSDSPRAMQARGFVEKPDAETARRFVASGRYLWNSGIFLFRAGLLLDLTHEHLPELARGLDEIAADPDRLPEIYASLPSESIDHGIMEKLDRVHCVPLSCGWSDLGSLAALEEVLPVVEAASGGVPGGPIAGGPIVSDPKASDPGSAFSKAGAGLSRSHGRVIEIEGRDNLLVAEHGTVTVLGVEGLIVVSTEDAVIVLPKERAQEVRKIVEELERRGGDLV